MTTETKKVPYNIGRNEAKKLKRLNWQRQRAELVADMPLVRVPKLRSYYGWFGY